MMWMLAIPLASTAIGPRKLIGSWRGRIILQLIVWNRALKSQAANVVWESLILMYSRNLSLRNSGEEVIGGEMKGMINNSRKMVFSYIVTSSR